MKSHTDIMRPSNELTLSLILVSTLTFFGYLFYFGLPSQCENPSYIFTQEILQVAGAQSLHSGHLLEVASPTYQDDNVGGIPKIIHQSWKGEELPHKFLEWSNTLRLKHPDWKWVRLQSSVVKLNKAGFMDGCRERRFC